MKVTRRQSVLAIVTVLGGALIRALPLRRPSWTPGSIEGQDQLEQAAAGRSSRRVEPAPHSVKRHG